MITVVSFTDDDNYGLIAILDSQTLDPLDEVVGSD